MTILLSFLAALTFIAVAAGLILVWLTSATDEDYPQWQKKSDG
jgi:hypothetical protein